MTTGRFPRWAQLLVVLSVLLAVAVLPASATQTRCPDGFVSGDTQFVYVREGAACRAYLVYYSTWVNQGYSLESWATFDPAYPGWLVLQRNGDGGIVLWKAGVERYINPARGVDVTYPAPAG